VPDLFFLSKIGAAARSVGVGTVSLFPGQDAVEVARACGAVALVVDLELESGDPLEPARRLRSNPATASARLVGFLSHVRADLREKAVEAGFDLVLPRSKFSAELPFLLRALATGTPLPGAAPPPEPPRPGV
jgi:CheY-like chemotaxis protein